MLTRILAAGCTLLAAGCGSRQAGITAPALAPVTVPLSTSLVTAQGTWAVAVMGGSAAENNNFWQLFVRPAGATRWSLVTPEGVADNGGLVAVGGADSLTVGFRPSQHLAYSPLATSTDTGRTWTPGLLDAALADTPDAIAVASSGRTLALLQDGTIEAAPTKAAAAAGQWAPMITLKALAASAPGRSCGLTGVTAVSFSPDLSPVAAGSCVRAGVAGIFTEAGGTWRSAGLTVPGRGPVRVLGLAAAPGGMTALLAAGSSLHAAWQNGAHWTVSAPVAAAGVRALGFGPGGSAWLLAGGRAETIEGPGQAWQQLPPVPAGTQVLVPAGTEVLAPAGTEVLAPAGTVTPGSAGGKALAPGADGSYQALAVTQARLTVWRLTSGTWAKAQQITVPIQYGSSG